ncbi:DUF6883 domain-containing protein [Halochromatium glycolicum]|uniref:DUF6883 domain-containing protein n=1 Tax=Halochromatium glycolicum TaxID=85075 RepID=A0AAJ0U6Z3_9GAMM|nr:DUF6883 domain-containing protein [Halochromatium glycolicum]MBK1706449.1 hypothetical protein [Halochromatium glycolicum]
MRIPNGHRANLGTKLEDYVLNPAHIEGRHKARVFGSALGITVANSRLLHKALEDAAASSDSAVHKGHNGFGNVYALQLTVATAHGTATVQSAWIIRDGEDFPRLTSCYVV